MFLEKITQCVDNFPDNSMELSSFTDGLVKTIPFIQFTNEDACQNLFDVLHSLECFMKRNRFDEKSGVAECTSQSSQVFESLKLKINQFIDEDVENHSKTQCTLSPESIMTLCLLYLENERLVEKCREKLKSVLHLACTDGNTCKFVVWCLLSILKKGSASGFEKNANRNWPAWVPIRNIDDQEVEENSSGVVSENILELLAAIVWKYPLCKEPNFEQFWDMALNYENIPDLEIWTSANKTEGPGPINCSNSDGRLTTLNFLLSALELGKVKLETKDKIISKIIRSMDNKQKLDLMSECMAKFKSETLEITRTDAAIAYLFLAQNFDENQIYRVTKPHKEIINQMLRFITEHPFAKLFYSIFQKCDELLEFETELKYFARKITESCEIGHWLFWTKIMPVLEKFKNSSIDILDLLLALENLIPTIAPSDGDDNLVQEMIITFARNHRELINDTLVEVESYMFSGGALLSLLKSHPELLKFDVMTKYINVWEGETNERSLWVTLGHYINLLNQDDLALQVCEIICRFLQSMKFDEALQSEFVAKNRSIFNEHVQHKNIPKNSALCYFSNFEAKSARVNKTSQREMCDFLENSFHLFAISSNDSRNLIVPIIESVCARIITESCSTGQQFAPIFEKYSQVIGNVILPNFNQCDINGLYILLAKNYPTIILDFPALSIETKMALIRHMSQPQLHDILKDCLNSLMHSSNEVRNMIVSVIDAVCLSIIDYSCFDKNLVSIFVEYSEVITDTILPNIEQREIKNLTTLLAMNYPKIIFKSITPSIETKKAIIKNIQPLELCDFLSDCFEFFDKSPKSARESILQMIESVCVYINGHLPNIKKQSATVFVRYGKLIADEILPNFDQNDFYILHKLLTENYQRIIFNSASSSIETKTKIVKNLKSTEFCDFLKDSFHLLEQSSDKNSFVQIIELICRRFTKPFVKKELTTIFAQNSKLIYDVILLNWDQCKVQSLHLLLIKNYPRIILNSIASSIETRAELVEDMSLNVLVDFLKESFLSFEQSSQKMRSLILPIIESICRRIIAFPVVEKQFAALFEHYSQLIADEIIPYWKQFYFHNLLVLVAKNSPRVIFNLPTLNIETKKSIVKEMSFVELCDFLEVCFDVFDESSNVKRNSITQLIECVCVRINDHSSSIGKRLITIFARYSELISERILPHWEQRDIGSLHIQLIKNYPGVIIDSMALDIQTKAKLVEHMNLGVSCDFLNYCFQTFDRSPNDRRSSKIPIIESVCRRIMVCSNSVEDQVAVIFAENSKLIADEILPNRNEYNMNSFSMLLTRNYPWIIFDFPALSIDTKKAIIGNMHLTKLYNFLNDCFDFFERSSETTRDTIVSIIELVCAPIIVLDPSLQQQSTRTFEHYSKLISDGLLPNWNQFNIKSLHILLMKNYPEMIMDSTTLSIIEKAELVDHMTLGVACDFLQHCLQSFDQSSKNKRNLAVPIIESVCGRIITSSDSVKEQLTNIFAEHSKLIAERILPNGEGYNIPSLHLLLAKNYPKIILDSVNLSIDTKSRVLRNMNLSEACKFLENCFESFKQSSEQGLIVPIIEEVCGNIINYPGTNANHLTNIFAEYANLIAESILPNWKQYEIGNLHILLAKNHPSIILDFPTLSIVTKSEIVMNMNSNESGSFLKYCFHEFNRSSKNTRTVIMPTIECVCVVVITNSGGVGIEFAEIFEQYSNLIAEEILPNWEQPEIKSFYTLLALNRPILLDFTTLSIETKAEIVEIIKPTALCDYLDEFFHMFDKSSKSVQNSILPIIESICIRLVDYPENVEKLTRVLVQYSKLIADEILPKFDQGDIEGLHSQLTYTCSKLVTNFDVRLDLLQHRLKKRNGTIGLDIDRRNALSTSYFATSSLTPAQWMSNFKITFLNEPGVDAGGLLREWFTITTRQILNPDYGFFTTAPGDANCYMINRSSYINYDHLKYFKFFGRFLAKGIIEGKHVNCHFTKALYKHILGVPVEYSDFQSEDPTYFQSLDFLVNNPVKDAGLDLTFTVEVDEFGQVKEKELIPNGKDIEVTDENKNEYVKLVTHMKMTESIQEELDAFLGGFYDIIPKHEIKNFYEHELELMLCGPSEIDIDDLKANTTYNHYQESDNVIQWFWRALRSFDKDDQARFLMFTSGSFKAPINGFATLQGNNGVRKFSIHKDGAEENRLPRAHTCFNQLDLPQYTSYEKLREKLLLAIREGTEGFGIV